MENQYFLVGILWGVTQRVTPKERSIETIGLGLSPLGKICPRPLWTDKLNFLLNNIQKINTFLPGGSPGVPQRVSWGAPRWRGDVDGRGEVDGTARSTARRGRWRGEVDGAARSTTRRGRRRGEVGGAARSTAQREPGRTEVETLKWSKRGEIWSVWHENLTTRSATPGSRCCE